MHDSPQGASPDRPLAYSDGAPSTPAERRSFLGALLAAGTAAVERTAFCSTHPVRPLPTVQHYN
jgi:hypothetical protein